MGEGEINRIERKEHKASYGVGWTPTAATVDEGKGEELLTTDRTRWTQMGEGNLAAESLQAATRLSKHGLSEGDKILTTEGAGWTRMTKMGSGAGQFRIQNQKGKTKNREASGGRGLTGD